MRGNRVPRLYVFFKELNCPHRLSSDFWGVKAVQSLALIAVGCLPIQVKGIILRTIWCG